MANSRQESRQRRHERIRKNVSGTKDRLRLSIYRSLNNIYAQIIDDTEGHTLVSASSLDNSLKELKQSFKLILKEVFSTKSNL